MSDSQPTVIFLVGLPCSGKSTWTSERNLTVVSSDQFIDHYAKQMNKTYSESFVDYIKTAEKLFLQQYKTCLENNESIIVDRTNLTKKGRKRLLQMVPKNYQKRCVIFNPPLETIKNRLLERNKTGKIISDGLIDTMLMRWSDPSVEEGFDHIETVTN